MKTHAKSITVLAPGDVVTGGAELLHQLVHELRSVGYDAFMSYYPFDRPFSCPAAYEHYNAPNRPLNDREDTVILLPEIYAEMALNIRRSSVLIWWLSVDNFLDTITFSTCEGRLQRLALWKKIFLASIKIKSFHWKHLTPLTAKNYPSQLLSALRRITHLSQSQYATDFLMGHGIYSSQLSDYLNQSHFEELLPKSRIKQVVYNPKKGAEVTSRLRETHRDISFVALEGLDSKGVANLLRSSAVYIDFGHHPGKDRIPREGAIAGCCVITGRRGSAQNNKDIPIPARYKIDETAANFVCEFGSLIRDVFDNPAKTKIDFETYVSIIKNEPRIFKEQVSNIFCKEGIAGSPRKIQTKI